MAIAQVEVVVFGLGRGVAERTTTPGWERIATMIAVFAA